VNRFFAPNKEPLFLFAPNKDKAFKVANKDPETGKYDIVSSHHSFIQAYGDPSGSHIIQTHGTAAELQRMVTEVPVAEQAGRSAGVGMAKRGLVGGIIGTVIAGPIGGLIGASTGAATTPGTQGGWNERPYELPHPIITPKSNA
jgi:hypothetical protein